MRYLKENKIDALLLTHPADITYELGFLSREAFLLVTRKKKIYFTDSRYKDEARKKLKKGTLLKIVSGSALKSIAQTLKEAKIRRLGFQEKYLSYSDYKELKKYLSKKIKLIPTKGIITQLREIKNKQELLKIRRAVQIAKASLKYIARQRLVGLRERDLASELERFIREQGAEKLAFEIIVASGPNSSFPHHLPTGRRIRKNDILLIDVGADYKGYKSDLTRVFFLGKIKFLYKKIYRIVQCANSLAIKQIRPGVNIREIDKSARNYINQAGYAQYFSHNLGHGVGLEVHEAPSISEKVEGVLKEGMVFTVEPAIYLPNKFGIRIEDMVLVTKKGCEVLSGALHK